MVHRWNGFLLVALPHKKILPFCLREQHGSMESYNIFRGFLLPVFLYTELIHIVSFVVDGYDYGQFLYTEAAYSLCAELVESDDFGFFNCLCHKGGSTTDGSEVNASVLFECVDNLFGARAFAYHDA